jgi:Flp pilus assembly protein TadG
MPVPNLVAMARSLRGLLASLRAEVRGVALVETALAAPVMIALVIGLVDTARYGQAKLTVQQGVNRGLEMSMMNGPTLSATDIQTEAASQAGVDPSAVTVTQTLECSGTATTWSSSCTSSQETARYTQIQISTTFSPSFVLGSMAKLYGDANGNIPISVTGVVRIQ